MTVATFSMMNLHECDLTSRIEHSFELSMGMIGARMGLLLVACLIILTEAGKVCYFLGALNARMVKLVDTLGSGSSGRKAVEIRVLFRASPFRLSTYL